MTTKIYSQKRPIGEPKPDDFELLETPIPEPEEGAFVVRNHLFP